LAILGLRFYTVAALAGFGIAWGSGIYLALIGFRGNPAECTSACLLGLVPGGLGWLLVLVCGHRAFILFFVNPRREKGKLSESLEIGRGLEEERILEITRETLAHRRMSKRLRNVETLAWSDTQRWEWLRFKWQGYRKPSMLVVSAGLRGRLKLEDWKTYLSWHYLQHKPRQTWYVAQPTLRALLPVLLFSAVAVSLNFNIGPYASELFGAIFGPPVLLLFGYLIGPAIRRLFLRLDAVAAESLGSMTLFSLFTMIDGLQLPENENAKKRVGWAARLWPEPHITERMANLQRTFQSISPNSQIPRIASNANAPLPSAYGQVEVYAVSRLARVR